MTRVREEVGGGSAPRKTTGDARGLDGPRRIGVEGREGEGGVEDGGEGGSEGGGVGNNARGTACLLYTSPSPRDLSTSRMPSSA